MTERPIRRWALWLLLGVLAFGVFAAALMTWHHEQHLAGQANAELLGCTESAEISCDAVNTSAWSELLGVPTATWAIPTYLAFAALAWLGLRGRRGAVALIFVGGCVTSAFSAWLFYVAETEVGFLCAWCMRMYAVNFATLVLAAIAARPTRPDRATLVRAAAVFAGVAAITIIVQRVYRGQLQADAPADEPTPAIVTGAPVPAPPEPKPLDRDPAGLAPKLVIAAKAEDGKPVTLTINADDAWKGSLTAAVSVVEFGDLQCGYCKKASTELDRVFAAYQDRVVFVWKHFAMNPDCNPGVQNKKHVHACEGAIASVCARQQRRFWPFHDAVFADQQQLANPDGMRTQAEHLGLDLAAFDKCVGDPATIEHVRADGEQGKQVGIHGTPRIFVNGTLHKPTAYALALAVEKALGSADPVAKQRAAAFGVASSPAPQTSSPDEP